MTNYIWSIFTALPIGESRKKTDKGVLVLSYKNVNIVERGYLPGKNQKNVLISFHEDVPVDYKIIGSIELKDKSSYATISSPK